VSRILDDVVFGPIYDTGTAVLLDEDEKNAWLYHEPDVVDAHFTGMTSRASMVMRKGEVMFPETSLTFYEEYEQALVHCNGRSL
jgi:hypothetical protein